MMYQEMTLGKMCHPFLYKLSRTFVNFIKQKNQKTIIEIVLISLVIHQQVIAIILFFQTMEKTHD